MFGFKGKANNSKGPASDSPPVSAEYINYETLYSTTDFGQIALIKSVFDGEGITYFFQGENAACVRKGLSVNLLVKKDPLERAKEILLLIFN